MSATPLFTPYPLADYLAHRESIDRAVQRVLARGHYVLGEETLAFEKEFASWLGIDHVIGVGNGTDALALALQAVGVAPGDVVATVSHTAIATVAAIELAGATPLFVDVDPATLTLDPARLLACLRDDVVSARRLRAVVPVHLYGRPAAMRPILAIARDHHLRVVEDCAQAAGAMTQDGPVGTLGDAAAFSFYPTKNLSATGDAGAVATRDPHIAARVRQLRQYGWTPDRVATRPGRNSRLDDLQAAVLRVKLPALHTDNSRRRTLAARYDAALSGIADLRPPAPASDAAPGDTSVFHQYVVRTAQRTSLQSALAAAGVPTGIHYPVPAHLHPAYAPGRTLIAPDGLACTEKACREVLSLPLHPHLPDAAIDHAAGTVRHWAGQHPLA